MSTSIKEPASYTEHADVESHDIKALDALASGEHVHLTQEDVSGLGGPADRRTTASGARPTSAS
jgi:hypothetical protein